MEKFADEWGPEKVLLVYDPEVEMKGVLVIDNTTLGPGKGGIRMLPTITTEEIFGLPVDVLIPAALSDVITRDNVDRVEAKMVVEAANIPIRAEIEEVLRKRGVLVVPDILANAGGVISSYAEYRGYNPK